MTHPWKGGFNSKERAAMGRKRRDTANAGLPKFRSQSPERNLARGRKYRGLPEPTRPAPETCECCNGPPGKHARCLDHDHTTGKFRGWLCFKCNTAIRKLGDTVEGVQRAIDYLTRSSASITVSDLC